MQWYEHDTSIWKLQQSAVSTVSMSRQIHMHICNVYSHRSNLSKSTSEKSPAELQNVCRWPLRKSKKSESMRRFLWYLFNHHDGSQCSKSVGQNFRTTSPTEIRSVSVESAVASSFPAGFAETPDG